MKIFQPDIEARISIQFGVNANEAILILQNAIREHSHLDNDRVIRCILFLSDNNIEKLRFNIDMAIVDPRDIIVCAEYESTGEQNDLQQIRDFSKGFKE